MHNKYYTMYPTYVREVEGRGVDRIKSWGGGGFRYNIIIYVKLMGKINFKKEFQSSVFDDVVFCYRERCIFQILPN